MVKREEELWSKYKESKSLETEKELMRYYIYLLSFVIYNPDINKIEILDDRDYFQLGLSGLQEAIKNYNPKETFLFEKYAISKIRKAIIDGLRKISKEDNIPIFLKDEKEEVDKNNLLRETLLAEIEKLNEKEKMIVLLYYYENLGYKEIASFLKIKISDVSCTHAKILEILKCNLKNRI